MVTALVNFTKPAVAEKTWFDFWCRFASRWWAMVDRWIILDDGGFLTNHKLPFDVRVISHMHGDPSYLASKYLPTTGKLLLTTEECLMYDPDVVSTAITNQGMTAAVIGDKPIIMQLPAFAVMPAQWLDPRYQSVNRALEVAWTVRSKQRHALDGHFQCVPYCLMGADLINRFSANVAREEPPITSNGEFVALMWWYVASQTTAKTVDDILELVDKSYMSIPQWESNYRAFLRAHEWLSPKPIVTT